MARRFTSGGRGELLLDGGTVKFTDGSYTSPNFFLGRYVDEFPGTFGVLRGWGTIAPSSKGATNVRMLIGQGQVIADGGGEARELDLNSVVNVTNSVVEGPSGTSGWYAVNKGAVSFPRSWFRSDVAVVSRCIGDYPYCPQPGLVNSVRLTVKVSKLSQDGNFIRGGVYAPDRDDVHADELPPNAGVAGFWKLGIFDSLDGSGTRAFTDIDLTFRYDAAKVAGRRRLSLRRYEGTRWVRVGRVVPQEGEMPLISTERPLAPLAGPHNVGLFAVTADKANSAIIIR